MSLCCVSPEAERLRRQFPENEKLIASIPSRFYEVIYPVQLRSQQKIGISTRDANFNRVRQLTGKHYHQTSLLIKAFNYKFRLDLELNSNLIAPNMVQKHFLQPGVQQIPNQEIEHCYYHGTIKDKPDAMAAFRTCNGVSGIIHYENETFAIHPFYGGDLSRDVRQVDKFVELALILDQAMFYNRNTSKTEVVNDAIQIINCVDMYFRSVRTRVSVVYMETWAHEDQATVTPDVRRTLLNLMEYTSTKLYQVSKDATHLLTGRRFTHNEVGMAIPDSICTTKAVAVNQVTTRHDTNILEPHLAAVTVAHMLSHNLGMNHDPEDHEDSSLKKGSLCQQQSASARTGGVASCPAPSCKCLPLSTLELPVTCACLGPRGRNFVQPYHFSSCSLHDYITAIRNEYRLCLMNLPGHPEDHRSCGNGIVDEGEDCDCGKFEECPKRDPCCDPITCKLVLEAECSEGPCCENCKLRPLGYPCRTTQNDCDLPEVCDGQSGQCPEDVYKMNGTPCKSGYCYFGSCPIPDDQCAYLWGDGALSSDLECYKKFNEQGSINGNCGKDSHTGNFLKCSSENILCGSLQCQRGGRNPLVQGMDKQFTRTIVSIEGKEFECKVTHGTFSRDLGDIGLVKDGSRCSDDMICVNQSCQPLHHYIDPGRCPTNNIQLSCSGHGDCSNILRCVCHEGWRGDDCSIKDDTPRPPFVVPTQQMPSPLTSPAPEWSKKQSKKSVLVSHTDALTTPHLVIVLVSVVASVFILFALMATCYSRKSAAPKPEAHLQKPVATEVKRPMEETTSRITFAKLPSYKEDKDFERRHMLDAGTQDNMVQLSPNNLSKIPEKGILKHGAMISPPPRDDVSSQSDNQETDMERTLKSLNGYHEDFLEDMHHHHHHQTNPNIEDLLRQLEEQVDLNPPASLKKTDLCRSSVAPARRSSPPTPASWRGTSTSSIWRKPSTSTVRLPTNPASRPHSSTKTLPLDKHLDKKFPEYKV
ncbi:ADAM22 [Cordylochernes scorpioides]|uniref:ADAM22 n=1 Tax=Cordylochernes scorpioides TaxID=51811 RepID=A0ABY6LEJ6_9ARAC|nr:ADAM22 [Cordylochernes scorpioides]